METSLIKINLFEKPTNSLMDIIRYLKQKKFDLEKEYLSFEIDPNITPITAKELEELITLPFEISLTERSGLIIIETGKKDAVGAFGVDYRNRRTKSRLSMHTHPIINEPGKELLVPSFSDLYISEVNEKTPLILATRFGIMQYNRPIYNPVSKNQTNLDPRDVILDYVRSLGINTLFIPVKGLREFFDLSINEQISIQTRFAEESGVILRKAQWNDEKGLEPLLDMINLRSNDY